MGRVRPYLEGLESRCLFAALTIAQENQLSGTPSSQWQVVGNGDTTLQGFADGFSFNVGTTANFKIDDQNLGSYHIDIYRIGYYQGNGARLITTISTAGTTETQQPAPITVAATQLRDCGNWSVSASWAIPADATSGVYIARLVRDDTNTASHIPFVVRNDGSQSDLIFQTSDTTWQAYNDYGGSSLYAGTSPGRAYKVSYNRPFFTRGNQFGRTNLFETEYPAIKWIERNGYDVSYFSGMDADRFGSLITQHKAFLSVGHDEYWSANQRTNVEAARDAGVNLAFLSGNAIFWKTRWENSIDGSGTTYRTLVCYKETHDKAKIDPSSEWTGTWRDYSFSPPSDGARPENALTGTLYTVNAVRADPLTVSSAQGALRFWRNTPLSNLSPGQSVTFATGVVGYEWDEDIDNGFRPAGLFDLSRNTVDVSPNRLTDFGTNYGDGIAHHSLTLYRAPSGALVFGAGTIDWAWALDGTHDDPDNFSVPVDARIQQATVNVFADMLIQPATLQSGLVATTASTDSTAPSAAISTSSGTTVNGGSPVTITGFAFESGGGEVAGVEVSTDNGLTWHPATPTSTSGFSTWAYTFVPNTLSALSVRARAVDDTGNLSAATSPITLNIQPASNVSVFSTLDAPLMADAGEAAQIELGVKFRSDINGYITGVRFYKSSLNTGTHVGTLWSSAGALLAQATFVSESASGWQQVNFSTPVAVTAGTTYVASYHTNAGHYSGDNFYFKQSAAGNGPLHALKEGTSGSNGVYRYTASSAFPTDSFRSSNYWVDPIFAQTLDSTPPTATLGSESPTAGTATFDFTVTYTDSGDGVDASSFDNNDITVQGPNGFLANATFISANVAGNGATRIVTYRITAPGGTWNVADDGVYTVVQQANQIRDLAGNYRAAGTIGTFTIGLPFAYQVGSTVYVDFDGSSDVITLSAASGDITASTPDETFSFTGVATVSVTGTSGNDVLNFSGPVSPVISLALAGGNDTLNINSGTFTFSSDAVASTAHLTVNVNAGQLLLNASQHLASLNIADGAAAMLATNGSHYLQSESLSIAPTGALDLTDNDLVVTYVSVSPFTTIHDYLIAGYSGEVDPTKHGIISSTSQGLGGTTILALLDNVLVNAAQWPAGSGNTVPANAIVGKYTYFGDLNLDGQISGDDYSFIDANLDTTPDPRHAWLSGDANLDGHVSGDDYSFIDANLGVGAGNPLAPLATQAKTHVI